MAGAWQEDYDSGDVLLGKIPGNSRGRAYPNRDSFPPVQEVLQRLHGRLCRNAAVISPERGKAAGRKGFRPGKNPRPDPGRYILHWIGSSVFLTTVRRVNEELIRRTPGRLANLRWVLVKSVLSLQTTRST